jgi:ring-1,2-phenylacetyl-CoA epoxidase subunit PaaC
MNAPTTSGLTAEVAAGLANLIGVVGDNKYYLGRWLSEWAVGAPGLENAVAAAAIAQGHLGQARTLFPFIDELAGGDVSIGSPDTGRTRRYCLSVLDEPFETWARAVAVLYLVGPALDVLLRSVRPPQAELARRLDRTLDEARFHHDFATGRLDELTTRWEHGRAQLEPHLGTTLVEVLCWFGPADEPGVEALHAAGVLTLRNEPLRQRFLDVVAPKLRAHGYALGVDGAPGRWTYEELPWERWNPLQRRLETAAA